MALFSTTLFADFRENTTPSSIAVDHIVRDVGRCASGNSCTPRSALS